MNKEKSKKPGYYIQMADHWSTIIGSIVSIILAGFAIYLTIQQEKTDQKVKLLENLVIEMNQLQQQNVEIIKELSIQRKATEEQLSISKAKTKIAKIRNTKDLEVLDEKLDQLLITFNDKSTFLDLPPQLRKNTTQKFSMLVSSIKSNSNVIPKESLIEELSSMQFYIDDINNNRRPHNYNEFIRKAELISAQIKKIINDGI